MLAGLTRALGALALLGLVGAIGLVAWGAVRLALYVQHDDLDAMGRKAEYLELVAASAAARPARPPNLVFVLFDDLGDGDLGFAGSRAVRTPAIDRLAAEGVRLTDFYAPASLCTPSRAGFLTGRYPVRTRLDQVVFPAGSPISRVQKVAGRAVRLPAEEITLGDALRAAGYATGIFGKWHLGDVPPSLPNDFGFDRFVGVLYSNDMRPLALYEDREIAVPAPVDQATLTERYTRAAVEFVRAHRDEPFFVYLPHTFPHVPLHASPAHAGESEAGLYGDVVADLDRSVATLVGELERLGLADRTLIVLSSDNGPWYQGSTGSLRGRKNEVFEGGMRVPFVAYWPGHLPAGRRSDAPAMGIDLLPTFLGLAGVPVPGDRVIDGRDLMPLLEGRADRVHERLFFYLDGEPLAVREGRFKLHARHGVWGGWPFDWWLAPLPPKGPWLIDLALDPDESYDASSRHPETAAALRAALERQAASTARDPRGFRTGAAPD